MNSKIAETHEILHASVVFAYNAAPQQYDRMIFGQFIEHFHRIVYGGIYDPGHPLSGSSGFRKDVIDALRALKVPIVRWPGGCFVSAYHWINGISTPRTPSYDKAWHVEDPNTFGTDEFVAWCRLIGAEPYICTNAGTGTPEEMSNWVEYCNLPHQGQYAKLRIKNGQTAPYNVHYWSIGNENYGAWEMGAKTVDEWGNLVSEAGKLMVNVDPSIKLLAAALADPKWTVPLLKRAGKWLNYVSIHGYWDPLWQVDAPSDYLSCMMRTCEPEKQIKRTIRILKQTHFLNIINIAFDEWNLRGWHHPGFGGRPTPADIEARQRNDWHETYTMADALFSACFLNSCLRNCQFVKIACMAPLINGRGLLYVSSQGIVKRTTYHVMSLYANLLQPYVVPVKIQSDLLRSGIKKVPAVDIIVTSDEKKSIITIAVVNKHPSQAATCDFTFNNWGSLPAAISATILHGDSVDAFNSPNHSSRVVPETITLAIKQNQIHVPAHSLTIFTVKR